MYPKTATINEISKGTIQHSKILANECARVFKEYTQLQYVVRRSEDWTGYN